MLLLRTTVRCDAEDGGLGAFPPPSPPCGCRRCRHLATMCIADRRPPTADRRPPTADIRWAPRRAPRRASRDFVEKTQTAPIATQKRPCGPPQTVRSWGRSASDARRTPPLPAAPSGAQKNSIWFWKRRPTDADSNHNAKKEKREKRASAPSPQGRCRHDDVLLNAGRSPGLHRTHAARTHRWRFCKTSRARTLFANYNM